MDMLFDPATGKQFPYPADPYEYRNYHGPMAWLYNPYTGDARNPLDIGTDVFGYAIVPTKRPERPIQKIKDGVIWNAPS